MIKKNDKKYTIQKISFINEKNELIKLTQSKNGIN